MFPDRFAGAGGQLEAVGPHDVDLIPSEGLRRERSHAGNRSPKAIVQWIERKSIYIMIYFCHSFPILHYHLENYRKMASSQQQGAHLPLWRQHCVLQDCLLSLPLLPRRSAGENYRRLGTSGISPSTPLGRACGTCGCRGSPRSCCWPGWTQTAASWMALI